MNTPELPALYLQNSFNVPPSFASLAAEWLWL